MARGNEDLQLCGLRTRAAALPVRWGKVMSAFTGKIWPEYWIDCSDCEHHEPLAQDNRTDALTEATRLGWKRRKGRWICKFCQGASSLPPHHGGTP
jgi:hypothetical protein